MPLHPIPSPAALHNHSAGATHNPSGYSKHLLPLHHICYTPANKLNPMTPHWQAKISTISTPTVSYRGETNIHTYVGVFCLSGLKSFTVVQKIKMQTMCYWHSTEFAKVFFNVRMPYSSNEHTQISLMTTRKVWPSLHLFPSFFFFSSTTLCEFWLAQLFLSISSSPASFISNCSLPSSLSHSSHCLPILLLAFPSVLLHTASICIWSWPLFHWSFFLHAPTTSIICIFYILLYFRY